MNKTMVTAPAVIDQLIVQSLAKDQAYKVALEPNQDCKSQTLPLGSHVIENLWPKNLIPGRSPEKPDIAGIPINRLTTDQLEQEFAPKWHQPRGRTFPTKRPGQFIKLAKKEEADRLREEAHHWQWIGNLMERSVVPKNFQFIQLSGATPKAALEAVKDYDFALQDSDAAVLIFDVVEDYGIDPCDTKLASGVTETCLSHAASDLGRLLKHGFVHDELLPMDHNREQNRRFEPAANFSPYQEDREGTGRLDGDVPFIHSNIRNGVADPKGIKTLDKLYAENKSAKFGSDSFFRVSNLFTADDDITEFRIIHLQATSRSLFSLVIVLSQAWQQRTKEAREGADRAPINLAACLKSIFLEFYAAFHGISLSQAEPLIPMMVGGSHEFDRLENQIRTFFDDEVLQEIHQKSMRENGSPLPESLLQNLYGTAHVTVAGNSDDIDGHLWTNSGTQKRSDFGPYNGPFPIQALVEFCEKMGVLLPLDPAQLNGLLSRPLDDFGELRQLTATKLKRLKAGDNYLENATYAAREILGGAFLETDVRAVKAGIDPDIVLNQMGEYSVEDLKSRSQDSQMSKVRYMT